MKKRSEVEPKQARMEAELEASVAAGGRPRDADREALDRRLAAERASNALFGVPGLDDGFERVTESVFAGMDVDGEFKRLQDELTLGERHADRGSLREALDRARTNARTAHRLLCHAHLARRRYDLDADVVEGAMWVAASEVLEQEKERGERKKQITDADVRAKAGSMFPDEWRAAMVKRERVKRMVENVEDLVAQWGGRARDLQALLESARQS